MYRYTVTGISTVQRAFRLVILFEIVDIRNANVVEGLATRENGHGSVSGIGSSTTILLTGTS